MERRIRARIGVLLGFIVVVMLVFSATVYKMQFNNEPQQSSVYTYNTTVKAARGNLLDRRGRVLVSNRASYDLMITNYVLFNADDPNASLLELANALKDLGIDAIDHLPVSDTRPYQYTTDSLSVTWQGYYKTFLRERGWDADMSAENLLRALRDRYHIPAAWSDRDARTVIGLRYELDLRYITTLDAYRPATDLTAEQMGVIVERDIPGLTVEASTVRSYETPYAAHILGRIAAMDPDEYEIYRQDGYSMDALVGKEGLEKAFESALHGTDGVRVTRVRSDGEIVEEYYDPLPQAGSNVYLTLDLQVQAAAEQSLSALVEELRENGVGRDAEGKDAEGAAMVVMNVNTGEVLAAASYPTFDLANYSSQFNELLQAPYAPLYNRVTSPNFPGSVYKMVTTIAAIDDAKIGRYYEIFDKGIYTYYDTFQPKCHIYTSTGTTHGLVNMMQALAESCNYYFYEVGRIAGIDAIDRVAKMFGLGEKTGVEIDESAGTRANPETKAVLYADSPSESDWYGADTLQAAIGQSDNRFTPLQLAVYTSMLANGGTRYRATFLSKIVSSDYSQVLEEASPEVLGEAVYSSEAHKAIAEGMRLAATSGTASTYLKDYDITVCAKTGTAQHGGPGSDNASFVCYAPSEDAEIAIVIYVEKGAQGGNLGKAARQVMDVYFAQQEAQPVEIIENRLFS